MRWLIVVLILLIIVIQYRLWVSEGGIGHRLELERRIEQQKAKNSRLREHNAVLAIEVEELKAGFDVIEERAREQLGMIKEGETFFMFVEPNKNSGNNKKGNAKESDDEQHDNQ
ncbi:cell division protein FtsB [Candidatus Endobugula sertula]|uniref:Cell division protein FtsB n=1 Tax=Candidatus Endobugula sertula TaxID=62101 RepID=A0A1D2QM36_9GAMM|nr:cell division protein FtsB [Candidatus Endobugula sertula]